MIGKHDRLKLARQCLELIREIADRGANCSDSEAVGYAIQELTQVLFERTGIEDRWFEPISVEEMDDLPRLYSELDLLNGFMQDLARGKWLRTAGEVLIQ